MAWYDRFFRQEEAEEKLKPIQAYLGASTQTSRELTDKYETYYENLEVVNRAVNMVVDDAAEIPSIVNRVSVPGVISGIKRAKVDTLLNREPNPFQDINTFKRNLITRSTTFLPQIDQDIQLLLYLKTVQKFHGD